MIRTTVTIVAPNTEETRAMGFTLIRLMELATRLDFDALASRITGGRHVILTFDVLGVDAAKSNEVAIGTAEGMVAMMRDAAPTVARSVRHAFGAQALALGAIADRGSMREVLS
jgi:hypothetical protein